MSDDFTVARVERTRHPGIILLNVFPGFRCAQSGLRNYSAFTPASAMTFFQRSLSLLMKAAVFSGVPPAGTADMPSKRFTTSGIASGGTYWCVFSNGYRVPVNYSGTSVSNACYTNDKPDSITIEINGIRSNTINVGSSPPPTTPGPTLYNEIAWGRPGATVPLFSGGPGRNSSGASGPAATIVSGTVIQTNLSLIHI